MLSFPFPPSLRLGSRQALPQFSPIDAWLTSRVNAGLPLEATTLSRAQETAIGRSLISELLDTFKHNHVISRNL